MCARQHRERCKCIYEKVAELTNIGPGLLQIVKQVLRLHFSVIFPSAKQISGEFGSHGITAEEPQAEKHRIRTWTDRTENGKSPLSCLKKNGSQTGMDKKVGENHKRK